MCQSISFGNMRRATEPHLPLLLINERFISRSSKSANQISEGCFSVHLSSRAAPKALGKAF